MINNILSLKIVCHTSEEKKKPLKHFNKNLFISSPSMPIIEHILYIYTDHVILNELVVFVLF